MCSFDCFVVGESARKQCKTERNSENSANIENSAKQWALSDISKTVVVKAVKIVSVQIFPK